MPVTPLVVQLANQFRAALLAQERLQASAMVRYYGTIWGELQADIDALAAQIKRLQDAGQEFSKDKIYRLERMQNVQAQVAGELDKFSRFTGGAITAEQRAAIVAGERDAYQLTLAAFPPGSINVKFFRLHTGAVETMAGFAADGTPLQELIKKYVGDASAKFLDRLVAGLAEGKGPRVIADQLRSDFGMGLTKALQIARTEQLRAYRTATKASYNANDNVVKGWQRHADKGDRTCMACIMLDGKLYDLATDMDDHVSGRCTMLPVTKTYAELGIDAPEPQFQEETAREWFERQDEATQRQMMGNGTYDAWKDGAFQLDNIPKLTHNEIWGDSWTPASLYELLGKDAPIGTYEGWKAAQAQPGAPWMNAAGTVLDKAETDADTMRYWALDGLPGTNVRNEDVQAFAKNELVTELARRSGASYDDVNKLIAQWAASSNDNDMRSLAIQEDMAKILGIDLPKWQADKLAEIRGRIPGLIERGYKIETQPQLFPLLDSNSQQAILRSMYDYTQERLDIEGIGDTIRLYRGMTVDKSIVDEWLLAAGGKPYVEVDFTSAFTERTGYDALIGGNIEYRGSVLESWSSNDRTAQGFSRPTGSDKVGFVFEMDIPRSRIMGSARSGFGCLDEWEFIHFGAFNDEVARIVEVHPW